MTLPTIPAGGSLPADVPFAYVLARDGHYLKKRTPLFEACVRVDENPNLPDEVESLQLTCPKIPAALFAQVLAFFEAVAETHKTEAAALLTFQEGCWGVIIPPQTATPVSVDYDTPQGIRVAGTVHSHPSMSAFFSETDRKDEAGIDGIHIVVADRGFTGPDISCAVVVSGRRFDIDPKDVLEPATAPVDPPSEWLALVKPDSLRVRLGSKHERPVREFSAEGPTAQGAWPEEQILDNPFGESPLFEFEPEGP